MKELCFMAKNFGVAVCKDCDETCPHKKGGTMDKKKEEPKKKPKPGKEMIVDKIVNSIHKMATGNPEEVLKVLAEKEKESNLSPIVTLVVHSLTMGKLVPMGKAILVGMMVANTMDEAGLLDKEQLKKLMGELLEWKKKNGRTPFGMNMPSSFGGLGPVDDFDFDSLRNKFEGRRPSRGPSLNDFFKEFKEEFGKD